MRPRLLDLFCGAGGAAMGYHRAGFDVVGVDINPQPHYPFEFVQMHAIEALRGVEGYDVIHASPPCQPYTMMRTLASAGGKAIRDHHGDWLEETREKLQAIGVPYVIENVVGAPMVNPLMLCGSSFGLTVRRHRLFESSELIFGLPCHHTGRAVGVYGDHPQRVDLYRQEQGGVKAETLAQGQEAMGIDWMPWKPLTQAIPPAYTEWIGTQLIASLWSETAGEAG